MDLIDAVEKCKELLKLFPKLSIPQTKELKDAATIIATECGDALWEYDRVEKRK